MESTQVKFFVKPTRPEISAVMDCGWGNGYVILKQGHPYHGMHYMDVPVAIEWGLTFGRHVKDLSLEFWPELSECDPNDYVFGFDTAHTGQNSKNWPRERVETETRQLAEQLGQIQNEKP